MTVAVHVDLAEMKRRYRLFLNEAQRVRTRLRYARDTMKAAIKQADNSIPKERKVPDTVAKQFQALCAECGVTPEQMRVKRFNATAHHLLHIRRYIAWKLYTSNPDATYPILIAVFGRPTNSHTQAHAWVAAAKDDPKFQRPPMEGEYAN